MKTPARHVPASNAWIRSGALNAMVHFLEKMGIEPGPVLGREGMRVVMAADPYRKVSLPFVFEAFERTSIASGRPDMPLKIGLGHPLEPWGPFLMLFLNAPDVRTAVRDLCVHFGAMQSGSEIACIDRKETGFGLSYRTNHSAFPGWDIDNELSITLVMSIVNGLLQRKVTPIEIQFEHEPRTCISTYRKWLGIEPRFRARRNRLIYPSGTGDERAVDSDPQLYTVLSRHMRDLSENQPDENILVHIVRNNILQGLKNHTATLELIAAELGVDARTLQRRLNEEGTTFRGIVDEVRRTRACHFLENTQLGVTEIATELGYSESRSFIRAFKRLTGGTPSRYRRQHSLKEQ